MKRDRKQEPTVAMHQVAILIGLYLFGGKTDKSLVDLIDEHVADDARSAAAQSVAERIESKIRDRNARMMQTTREIVDTLKDHETRSPAFGPVFIRADAQWEQLQQEFVDLRFELKERLTREEWSLVLDDFVDD